MPGVAIDRARVCVLVGGMLLWSGCGGGAPQPVDSHEAEAEHPTEGPHHGELIELGKEEYHAELIHDDLSHKVTIYLLDFAAIQAVPLVEKELSLEVHGGGKSQEFKLAAVPQADDPAGQASRFELTDETLCKALDDETVVARLNVPIAGKTFAGVHDHSTHDHHHHGHKH